MKLLNLIYGINGIMLIPLTVFLIYYSVGQAKEVIKEIKKVW